MTSLFAPSVSISKSLKRATQDGAGSEAAIEEEQHSIVSGGKRSRNGPKEGAAEAELPETFGETVRHSI
jgi:hypothetical protein